MNETLDRLVAHYKEYEELSEITGGLACYYKQKIQVSGEFVLAMPGELNEVERGCGEYPYEISKVYDRVKFFAVTNTPRTPELVEKAMAKLRAANG